MKNRYWVALGVVVTAAVALQSYSAAQQQQVETIMRMKLKHTHAVLEGIATEDFDKIEKNAREVALLSQAAAWQVIATEEYKQHSKDFRRTADDLTRHAKEKNLDAAALDYVRLTTGCVNCHKHVRSVRVAGIDAPVFDYNGAAAFGQ